MEDRHGHIREVSKAIAAWLRPDNPALKMAIDRTVDENLFSFEDIRHRILHLRKSLTEENLLEWAGRSKLRPGCLQKRRVVCLHAGNLPLVGLQDALAVTLTGADYTGKVSRKDPWLIPTFLEKLREHDIPGSRVWSDQLDDLSGHKADAILFAGSEDSAGPVLAALKSRSIADDDTPRLMRTAHFSVAFLTDHNKKTMEDLAEAVFRYGGAGCRSVAVVIAPFGLKSEKCHLTDYAEAFWLNNPQHQKPDPVLFHRYAANKALGVEQSWLDDFLIEERISRPADKFVLRWVQGGEEELKQIVDSCSDGLQTIYTQTGEAPGILSGRKGWVVDKLAKAQTPDIWWKPDGVDTVEWLRKQLS